MSGRSTIEVTFGDCDPAGIVFYPNIFRWLDKTFHDYLRPYGGHEQICRDLGAAGIGLIEAKTQFLRPIRDGSSIEIELSITDWGRKTVTVSYEGKSADVAVFKAQEIRGLFKRSGDDMFAADLSGLRERLEDIDKK
jgi:4-hydroxybenzoyl-CoA thioesterase